MELKDKKVIVTGGVKGIGRSLVDRLIREDAVVGVFDIDKEGLDKLKSDNQMIYCKTCDVSNYKEAKLCVDEFYKEFKNIDVLVNNAGFIYNSPLLSLIAGGVKKHDVDMWHKVISTDLSSVFYMTLNVAEKMMLNRTHGVIVNVSSICAAGNAGQCAYSAAKAGVNALTATWAKELGIMGIRVAGVAPGYTETQTMKQSMSENVLKEWIRKTPLRRFGKPDEIAEGIVAVIKNDFFNGKVFEVDGGLVISG
jgi:3-oxoacyl-[acyl-carrier protein] reductase